MARRLSIADKGVKEQRFHVEPKNSEALREKYGDRLRVRL